VEENFPFSPISFPRALKIWKILLEKVIPPVGNDKHRIGETGGGLYRWAFRDGNMKVVEVRRK
jgi:hypothetical protein